VSAKEAEDQKQAKAKSDPNTFSSEQEIVEATNNFHPESVIGQGGFGVVYRGRLADGTAVAVKRASKGALRSSREFRTEVKLLSRLHHQVGLRVLQHTSAVHCV
jgi:serine/threonine protein kinase